MEFRRRCAMNVLFIIGFAAGNAWAQEGAALFETHCAICHEGDDEDRAPTRQVLGEMTPEQVLTALERGVMQRQGADRSRAERRALAAYLTGKPVSADYQLTMPESAFCAQDTAAGTTSAASSALGPAWNGWGVTTANTRFQPAAAAGLTSGDIPGLKLKWAFGFPGASSASAQPVVWGGRLYVGSWEGDVYSLDAATGCIHWMIEAEAGVRSAITIARADDGQLIAYFGDLAANVYAVDAMTGKQIWKVQVDDYSFARITGSPTLHDGRLYVPVSSREESQVGNPAFPCCGFRGSMVALDAATGRQIWKTYTIEQKARPTRKNRAGTQIRGPAGTPIWNSPTIDVKRNVLYVGTGNDYSYPSTKHSDSIVAFDLTTGAIRWSRQITANDIWNASCRATGDPATCPDTDAPDYDFAGSPVLVDLAGGRQLLLAAAKSSIVHALDPDKEGETVWEHRLGKGGTSGGIMWGVAADAENVYVALSDTERFPGTRRVNPEVGGGTFAVRLRDGQRVWSTPAPSCGDRDPCSPAQAAAVTAIPGVVFSGSNDGFFRAFSSEDGRILWEFDTVRDFDTVNSVAARGGSINNGGPAVVGGMVFTNAGYSHHSGIIPGNVLLAFSTE